MLVLGITGGVGAGKSAILDILENDYNAFVIKTDEVAHILMSPGHNTYDSLVNALGKDILSEDGSIDKTKMSSAIFGDDNKRQIVNSIVHPDVKKWVTEQIDTLKKSGEFEIAVIESALLLDDNYERICDDIWYIYADKETRRKRLKSSRGYSDAKIDNIYASQLSDEEFQTRCSKIVDNSKSLLQTAKQIRGIIDGYRLQNS